VESEFSILIDKTGKVFRANGEIGVVRARFPEEIKYGSVFNLFQEQDHDFIRQILDSATSNTEGRISDVTVLTSSGERRLFHMTVKPGGSVLWWFQFTPSDTELPQESTQDTAPEPTVIWIDFFDSVSYLIDKSPDKPIELMMLSFEALAGAADDKGESDVTDIRAAIESTLTGRSVDGRVGRLDNSSYTIVCDVDTEADDVVSEIGDATRELGLDAGDLGVRTRSVDLEPGSASAEQMSGAMAQIRRSFLDDDDEDDEALGIVDSGPISLGAVIDKIEISKEQITAALEAGAIQLLRYPVIELATGDTALHLMHGRLLIDGAPVPASRKLIMGDYPGLTLDHDLAMAREAIRQIGGATPDAAPAGAVVIDVNETSLGAPEFASNIADFLKQEDVVASAIGFRTLSLDLTKQSAPSYQAILEFLRLGHPVWLTRFGSAVTDSMLDGAYIEVTAGYLQRLCGSADGFELVSLLLEVWRNAHVRLVAMDVQSDDQVEFIDDLGIEYAVGPAAKRTG
jgi:EAL domain-containing protein (putative c-di-GMP-specific phosphodiesterase class I)